MGPRTAWMLLLLLLAHSAEGARIQPVDWRAKPPAPAKPGGHRLKPGAAQRFLRAFGYKSSLQGSNVRLKDGRTIPTSSIKTYEQLAKLQLELPRGEFNGLMGLSSKHPKLQLLFKNMEHDRNSPVNATLSDIDRLADECRVAEMHSAAVHALRPKTKKLREALATLGGVYSITQTPGLVSHFARKVGRLPDGAISGKLMEIDALAQRGQHERVFDSTVKLYDKAPTDPYVVRSAIWQLLGPADNHEKAQELARYLTTIDPNSAGSYATLGAVLKVSAQFGRYQHADGRPGSPSEGYVAAGQAFDEAIRRSSALNPTVYANLLDMVVPTPANEAKNRPTLREASRAYDKSNLDHAERLFAKAIQADPAAALAYNGLSATRTLRTQQDVEKLVGLSVAVPTPLRTAAGQKRLVAAALKNGIAGLIPDFEKQPLGRQAVIAYSALPMRSQWANLSTRKAAITVVPLHESVVSHMGSDRNELSFDGRHMYGVRFVENTGKALVGAESIDDTLHGGQNQVAHEFAHAVHENLSPALKRRIEKLYLKNRALDAYAAANQMEYFARGYEAMLTRELPKEWAFGRHTAAELKKKDPALFKLIRQIQHEKPARLRLPL